MKAIIILFSLFCFSFSFSQVGINTTSPTADLEVVSKTPIATGEYNGIIIPKVATIPTDVAPSGTIIYVTGGTTPGFYYSDGLSYINVSDTFTATGPFFESGTTDVASNNTQTVFRTGQTSIGEDYTGPQQFHVASIATAGSPRTTVGIANANSSTANSDTYGLDVQNSSSTTARKIGIASHITGTGTGTHIGVLNEVTDASGTTTNYGILSDVGATDNVGGTSYGIYSEIGTGTSRGTNYAIYAYSQNGTSSDPSYSGYFRGDRFAIRNENDSDGYDMPTVDGAPGQVLSTNGSGAAIWEDLPANNDNDATNEGSLSVSAGGANDAVIESNTDSNTVTISGSDNVNVSESGSTITLAAKNIVTIMLWGNTGVLYGITPNGSFTDRGGIQGVFDSSTISTTGNLELRLMVDQQNNSNGVTEYQLRAYDNGNTSSIPITTANTNFVTNGVTGDALITTTSWRPFSAGVNGIAKFILQARNTGTTNAGVRAVYLMVRNAD